MVAIESWLIDRATVYTSNPTTGLYDVVAKTDLHCRLVKINVENAGSQRAELLAARRMMWQADYEMPLNVQVDVFGLRWNIVEGTVGTFRRKLGDTIHNSCDLVRASYA